MKYGNIIKSVLALVAACVVSQTCFGQTTSTASAAATIMVPISMVKNVDMNFGNAAVSVSSGGSVMLTPTGTRTTTGGGVTLPATAGTVAAAKFTVSGAPAYTYNITLPASAVINGPGAATMTVNSFTSSPSTSGTLSMAGTQTFSVGATLSVGASQAPGIYTNASAVPVTVNYN